MSVCACLWGEDMKGDNVEVTQCGAKMHSQQNLQTRTNTQVQIVKKKKKKAHKNTHREAEVLQTSCSINSSCEHSCIKGSMRSIAVVLQSTSAPDGFQGAWKSYFNCFFWLCYLVQPSCKKEKHTLLYLWSLTYQVRRKQSGSNQVVKLHRCCLRAIMDKKNQIMFWFILKIKCNPLHMWIWVHKLQKVWKEKFCYIPTWHFNSFSWPFKLIWGHFY